MNGNIEIPPKIITKYHAFGGVLFLLIYCIVLGIALATNNEYLTRTIVVISFFIPFFIGIVLFGFVFSSFIMPTLTIEGNHLALKRGLGLLKAVSISLNIKEITKIEKILPPDFFRSSNRVVAIKIYSGEKNLWFRVRTKYKDIYLSDFNPFRNPIKKWMEILTRPTILMYKEERMKVFFNRLLSINPNIDVEQELVKELTTKYSPDFVGSKYFKLHLLLYGVSAVLFILVSILIFMIKSYFA